MIVVWRRAVVGLVAAVATACCPVHGYQRTARVDPAPSLAELAAACEAGGLRVGLQSDEPARDGWPALKELYVSLPDDRGAWLMVWEATVSVSGSWGHHPTDAECRELDAVFAAIVERLTAAGLALPFGAAEIVPIVRCERCAAGGRP